MDVGGKELEKKANVIIIFSHTDRRLLINIFDHFIEGLKLMMGTIVTISYKMGIDLLLTIIIVN